MANEVVPNNTEIRYSSASLMAAIPSWMSMADLDSSLDGGCGVDLPPGSGHALRQAADTYDLAMKPASSAQRHQILVALRSGTIPWTEGETAANLSLSMLRVHLDDVPLDILGEACRAYCNAPGKRFFPRSAGQLREFINPLMAERSGRARRLRLLAEQADAEEAERQRLADDPLTPEAVAAIKAEFGVGRAPARPPAETKRAPARATPDYTEYMALGLSEADARQAVADYERMMSRGGAKAVGETAAGAVTDLAA